MSTDDAESKSTDITAGMPPNARLAYCPKCGESMYSSLPICPHCGYDFPFGNMQQEPGLAFSRFADVVLIIAAAIASLAWVASLFGAVVTLVAGQPGASLFLLMWSFMLLALAIVFMRVQRMEPRDPGKGNRTH